MADLRHPREKPMRLVIDNTPRPHAGPDVFIFVFGEDDRLLAVRNGETLPPGEVMQQLADAAEAARKRVEAKMATIRGRR